MRVTTPREYVIDWLASLYLSLTQGSRQPGWQWRCKCREGGLCLLRDLLLPEVTWGTSLVLTEKYEGVVDLWGLLLSGHSI